jgi:hypothetical protein
MSVSKGNSASKGKALKGGKTTLSSAVTPISW